MDDQYTTLITAEQLLPHINDDNWLLIDCTFYLPLPDQGLTEYLGSHVPSAIYAHLNSDLSGKSSPTTGRHPLPKEEDFVALLGKWGLRPGMQVVVYDSTGGGMAAARLWWLLNYYGFTRVAILDGGFLNWLRKEYPVSSQIPLRKHTTLGLKANPDLLFTAQEIREISRDKNYKILDARTHIRYLGLEEVIDTSGGHIPGAISAPAAEFLDEDMYFKPIDEIKSLLIKLLDDTQPQNTVYYCGSGVAAALGIFVMVYTGYGMGRLYPGSWSEWIKQPWAEIAVQDE